MQFLSQARMVADLIILWGWLPHMTHGRVIDAPLDQSNHKLARDANCERHDTLPSVSLPVLVPLRCRVCHDDCIAWFPFKLSISRLCGSTDALPLVASCYHQTESVPKASVPTLLALRVVASFPDDTLGRLHCNFVRALTFQCDQRDAEESVPLQVFETTAAA